MTVDAFDAQTARSALDAMGPQAARIGRLAWVLMGVSAVVYALVLGVLIVGLARWRRGAARARAGGDATGASPPGGDERRLNRIVGAAVGVTVLVLLGFLGASVVTGKALASLAGTGGSSPLVVTVTGHQWWWEFRYEDSQSSRIVDTANELHIPVGRPIELRLASHDVIHSFWVPSLHGKRDVIPGYDNVLVVQADRPGVYPGRCAEFCGLQHAHMTFAVVAEPEASWRAWRAHQLAPAVPPRTSLERRGYDVFLGSACPACHSIDGTPAFGLRAPNLTHLGGRATLAAGSVPNTPAHLRDWIRRGQTIKPGNQMPTVPLPDDQLDALVAYLETLR